VAHGKILTGLCAKKGVRVRYQDGQNSYREREKALKWLSKSGDAIIATNIFDEGVDCRQINAVILAAGTKSAPALFQRTGRAARKKETDNYAIIIDFIDNHHRKLAEHSKRRYNLIKREKGFAIL
jgi:superfamily II DNA or RNA helicase